MISYTTDFTSILLFLHDHPVYLTAANALTTGWHNYTFSTLTPAIIIIGPNVSMRILDMHAVQISIVYKIGVDVIILISLCCGAFLRLLSHHLPLDVLTQLVSH